jgi:8-hydroxy-5-deazaflavin:NADPH oxidoreductase
MSRSARFPGPGTADGTIERVNDARLSGPGRHPEDALADMTIAVLGGTGHEGRGLARRLALAGHRVIIGSRRPGRAAEAAAELGREAPGIEGAGNAAAAAQAGIVIVAVPWDGHRELLAGLADELAGKIVVDCVNPIAFDAQGA